jgi:hypothetical protein
MPLSDSVVVYQVPEGKEVTFLLVSHSTQKNACLVIKKSEQLKPDYLMGESISTPIRMWAGDTSLIFFKNNSEVRAFHEARKKDSLYLKKYDNAIFLLGRMFDIIEVPLSTAEYKNFTSELTEYKKYRFPVNTLTVDYFDSTSMNILLRFDSLHTHVLREMRLGFVDTVSIEKMLHLFSSFNDLREKGTVQIILSRFEQEGVDNVLVYFGFNHQDGFMRLLPQATFIVQASPEGPEDVYSE